MFDKQIAQQLLNSPSCTQCKSPEVHSAAVKSGSTNQLGEFFTHIFDTSDFPARWHCGNWSHFHGWFYIVSDLMIWAAYFAIPIMLFFIVKKRKDVPFSGVFWLFIAFIFLCGSTHLIDAIIFWWPAYRLSAIIRFFTGLVSIATVYALYKILPIIKTLKTQEQLQAEIVERERAEHESRQHQILQKATEELMHKKDEFMSIASHELKTPITSIKASLQFIERVANKKDDSKETIALIQKASTQTNKLMNIINDLLDITRIQSGNLSLQKTSFNIRELVNECVEICQIGNNKHLVNIKGDEHLMVFADKFRIEQVICNLLTNAFKYSPDANKVDIWYETSPDGKFKLHIKDYGIGIPEDKVNGVFDRFYRVENTSQNFSGLGLGLFISSEIINRHDGEIGVHSKLGEGSTFYFTLPVNSNLEQ